jgi:hypothetical protein
LVVEKSTLPVRTAAVIQQFLGAATPEGDGRSFSVLSNPEFLAEGTAIPDLEQPDRVLIGGEDPAAIAALAGVYGQWVPIKTSFQQVMDKIKPITFLLENEEYKDKLPPLHTVEVNIEMEDMAPYNAMKRDFVVEMDGHQVTAMSAASLTTKCQQMSSGFLYDSDTLNKIKTPVWFSSHKFDRLEEILEENQHAPTIIFYQFIEELAELKRRFPQLCTLDSPNAVQRFNEGEIEILAAHPKSAGHGLNLQGTAHHIVFLSLPWSLELYEQAIGRLHRGGQKHAVWVYILMTKGTIDRRVFTALHSKRALAEVCIDELRD